MSRFNVEQLTKYSLAKQIWGAIIRSFRIRPMVEEHRIPEFKKNAKKNTKLTSLKT